MANWPIECVKCNKITDLHCYHNYYIKYLGHENTSDIDYLCSICHNDWHLFQKNSGKSQNSLCNEYYNFIYNSRYSNENIIRKQLLAKKMQFDSVEISNYFQNEAVIKYERLNNIIGTLFLISFILFFVVGIGFLNVKK